MKSLYDSKYYCYPSNNSPEPGGALLNAGTNGTQVQFPIVPPAPGSIPCSSPCPVLVRVPIDITNLSNPKVLLTFTCIISIPAGVTAITLNFLIIKTVHHHGFPQVISGPYTFSEPITAATSQSFTFQYCDFTPTSGNSIYAVQLDPINSTVSPTNTNFQIGINNVVLSALAVESL